MSEHPNLALIRAYNQAWTSQDIAAAAGYLAEDVVSNSPQQHLRSAEEFIPSLAQFAQLVTGPVEEIAALADDEQVLMLYDIPTAPFGLLRACDYFVIKNGKIQGNELLFDTARFRPAAAIQPPTAE